MRKALFPVIVLFCVFAQSSFADSARVNMTTIEKHFLEGRHDAVMAESGALIRSGYGKKDELYYLKGLSELKSNKFSAARDSFNYIISKCPWSKKIFEARIGVGDSYMLEGNNAKALSAYNDIVEKYGSDKNIAIVYGRLSLCHSNMGVNNKASSYHDMVKNSAPLSFEARSMPAPGSVQQNIAKRSAITTSADKGRYSVQVGSFKDKRNADRLARKLAARGYESYITIPVSGDDNYYRVKVGSFNSKSETQKLDSKLRADGYRTRICADNVCE